jgi:hypothetical protein
VEGAAGVSERLLGIFTERRTVARRLKLEPGASLKVAGRAVYLVLRGAGKIEETAARPLTTLFLEWGETGTITASEEMEVMHFGLPNLAGVTMTTDHDADGEESQAEAAE